MLRVALRRAHVERRALDAARCRAARTTSGATSTRLARGARRLREDDDAFVRPRVRNAAAPCARRAALVGVSVHNSQFTQEYLNKLMGALAAPTSDYDAVWAVIMEVPSRHTCEALGRPMRSTRRKCALLRSRVQRAMTTVRLDPARIIDGRNWSEMVLRNDAYTTMLYRFSGLYEGDAQPLTNDVHEQAKKALLLRLRARRPQAEAGVGQSKVPSEDLVPTPAMVHTAGRYVVEELAMVASAREVLGCDRVDSVYHRVFPPWQRLINGDYDRVDRESWLREVVVCGDGNRLALCATTRAGGRVINVWLPETM